MIRDDLFWFIWLSIPLRLRWLSKISVSDRECFYVVGRIGEVLAVSVCGFFGSLLIFREIVGEGLSYAILLFGNNEGDYFWVAGWKVKWLRLSLHLLNLIRWVYGYLLWKHKASRVPIKRVLDHWDRNEKLRSDVLNLLGDYLLISEGPRIRLLLDNCRKGIWRGRVTLRDQLQWDLLSPALGKVLRDLKVHSFIIY